MASPSDPSPPVTTGEALPLPFCHLWTYARRMQVIHLDTPEGRAKLAELLESRIPAHTPQGQAVLAKIHAACHARPARNITLSLATGIVILSPVAEGERPYFQVVDDDPAT